MNNNQILVYELYSNNILSTDNMQPPTNTMRNNCLRGFVYDMMKSIDTPLYNMMTINQLVLLLVDR